ncbi:MAG: PAS domain-containing sensor histidine kinase [Ruminococcus sp.]|nr:PAS domain-containing sensor histidine kinase [Ruminococcus sp.]
MKKNTYDHIKDTAITVITLSLSFIISLLFQYVFEVREHVTTVFVFAVFLISFFTKGYAYGILASFVGMLAINYAFTFPYFAFNFIIPVNLISAIVMVIISILTSALTTKLKQQEAIKAEGEKERMRADLLRAVSHDLRTPLTTIYASSTTLLENSTALTDERKSKIVEGIKEDSEWLIRMVENLLSITRIDSGRVKIIKTPTVLEELVDSVILKFRKRYPAQEVGIEIPEDMVIIPMDAILIEQVLVNLLENAVRHAAGMTELSLRVFTVGNRVIFEVEDNGCGLAPEHLKNIFSGYYERREELADGQKKNAGIGLSVCAAIIKAHGGDIRAENVRTGGALFRFTLDMEETDSDE